LDAPQFLIVMDNGRIFVGDEHNRAIRLITPEATISTLIGDANKMNLDFECINSTLSRLTSARTHSHHANNQLTVSLFGVGIIACTMIITKAANAETYYDDTHSALQNGANVKVISGDYGYDSYKFNATTDGDPLTLDARNTSFTLANSKNSNPAYDVDCKKGPLPINRYPVKVYNADMTSFTGGIINGEIPQESDWKPSYCNSAGVIFKNAAGSKVDGLRITSAWDAIRAGGRSPDLTIKDSWISNVRDDAIENDDFYPLIFEDNLVDGAFQGISVHSGGSISNQSLATIELYGNVIRIREYLYKGKQKYGALFKSEDESPTSIIYNTVVAVDYNGGSTFNSYWERSWSKIEACSNNLFLWLSDQPIPASQPLPPACFTVLTGTEARAAWARAKNNWIDCHPKVSRTPTDPTSNPEQCVANTFGGYSR
jgi:hypothetical protein